ncbi:MAG: protein kinase [Actinomycetota bacterium]
MADGVDLGISDLSDYKVIGAGGFSTVYSARDTGFNRRVAVKVLHSLDADGRRRFDRERAIMGQLSSHPNVITPFRAGYTPNGAPYLVMEFVAGGSLEDRLRSVARLPWRTALDYIIPVTKALAFAHAQGVLHRDVKPGNILLDRDTPKLTDFGIAAIRESTASQVAYTLAHCPPETFASGRDNRDERSDLYAMMSTLHTLITGAAPFDVDGNDSQQAYMFRIIRDDPPPIGDGLAPRRLVELLTRSLSKEPDDRPQSAEKLIEELEAIRALPDNLIELDTDPDHTIDPDPTAVAPVVKVSEPPPTPSISPEPAADPDLTTRLSPDEVTAVYPGRPVGDAGGTPATSAAADPAVTGSVATPAGGSTTGPGTAESPAAADGAGGKGPADSSGGGRSLNSAVARFGAAALLVAAVALGALWLQSRGEESAGVAEQPTTTEAETDDSAPPDGPTTSEVETSTTTTEPEDETTTTDDETTTTTEPEEETTTTSTSTTTTTTTSTTTTSTTTTTTTVDVPPAGLFRLRSRLQGDDRCLDANQPGGSDNGGAAFMAECAGSGRQQWTAVNVSGARYRLQSRFWGDQRCLDSNDPDAPTDDGGLGAAYMTDCDAGDTGQIWRFVDTASGIQMQSGLHGTTLCLESNDPDSIELDGAAFMAPCRSQTGTLWVIETE